MVLISTDKAVDPTNVMGATKRLAEAVIRAQQTTGDSGTRFSRRALRQRAGFGRFGGADLQVADRARRSGHRHPPDMKRFFMTIPEAAQLVLHATAALAEGDAASDAPVPAGDGRAGQASSTWPAR